MHLLCISLILGGAASAGTFRDGFDTARNYLTDGVAGTGWDGFLGKGAGETVTKLDASTTRPGQLYMESTNSFWQDPWQPAVGPFLYKVVQGDFVATVKVTDYAGTAASVVYHNNCGLMVRRPGPAGGSENWVALDYFPIWNCGNFVRSATNNVRTENGNNSKQWNLDPWLQIERKGNVFYFRTSQDGVTWTNMPVASLTRPDFANVAVQVGLAQAVYSGAVGYAAFDNFTLTGPLVVPPSQAYNPYPGDKATEVILQKILLTWTGNEKAIKHDVYFGAAVADVNSASRTNLSSVKSSVAQDANSFDPGSLERGRTYYWRVDEVMADGTIARGEIWSFTMEPVSYPIAGVTATASSFNPNMGPEKAVNGSGMSGDCHSNVATDMWLSGKNAAQPTWIQFAFDKVYKLDKVLVWNSNQAMESMFGFGVKDVLVEYSTDGTTWASLDQVEVAQASGDVDCTPSNVDLGGAVAKYVKFTIKSNWGGMFVQYGLSEVRFYYIPVWAREPKPAAAATGLNPQVSLNWRSGREAASHQIYLSTDKQAVQNGTAPVVSVTAPSYDAAVNLAQTYYWKVVEVNEAKVPAAWEGDVWSFTTAQALVVDDFESYTDAEGKEIYRAWIDGYDNPAKNGAIVGYDKAPFAERTIRHGGQQSMPLAYNNTGGAVYSEAERTFNPPQDWSQYGITTLTLWFRGDANNTPAPLYLKINGTKVPFNNNAPSTGFLLWKQWNVDLASLGISLKSVKTLTIGIGDGTSGPKGRIYVDDIALYPAAPQVVVPVDPGTGALVALYAMEGNVQDTSGKGNSGTVSGNPAYANSMSGFGKALKFDGLDDYVTLPIGSLLSTLSNITVATWINFSGTGGAWQRVWDFGTGDTNYMFLSSNRAGTQSPRFAIRTTAVAERTVTAPAALALSVGWHHLAVTIDGTTKVATLYVDGAAAANATLTVLPKDLGNTNQNWIGRSQYTADAFFNGIVDDFRIYNVSLTAGQVRYLAGDR
jgi:hypothetical protein